MSEFIDFEYINKKLIAADEVGRGPLAGPVVACAVGGQVTPHLLKRLQDLKVTDSKKLTSKKRIKILEELKIDLIPEKKIEMEEFSFFIKEISPKEIDSINIFQASMLAMKKSCLEVAESFSKVDQVFIDGKFPIKVEKELPNSKVDAIIQGDSKSLLIGLASIIAKEYRDQLMEEFAEKYPGYGFESHAGYPTKKHKTAIAELGVTPIHRKTFKGVKEFL